MNLPVIDRPPSGPRSASPLSASLLEKMHSYWRAANYLSVGQIYLRDNTVLAQKPIRPRNRVLDEDFDRRFLIIRTKRSPLLQSEHPAMARALWHPRKAIADRDDTRRRDGGAVSVTANSSSRATLVAMMQTADLREGDDSACGGRLYGPRHRTILAKREMRAALVVVLEVCRQHSAQVTLIEDDDVIKTFAADGADDALDIGVLPWRSRCGDDLLDRHGLNMITEDLTI